MSLKDQENLCLGIQFLLDSENAIIKKTEDGDLGIYLITPKGKKFLGIHGLVHSLWMNPLNLLSENILNTVTFYSESYTKAMMPDRIAGGMSSLMIAYAKVFRFLINTDSRFGSGSLVDIDTDTTWKPRFNKLDSPVLQVPPNKHSDQNNSIKAKEQLVIYPFLFRPDYYPDLLRYFDNSYHSGSMMEVYSDIVLNKGLSFPNIRLKENLDEPIQSLNPDIFNILL